MYKYVKIQRLNHSQSNISDYLICAVLGKIKVSTLPFNYESDYWHKSTITTEFKKDFDVKFFPTSRFPFTRISTHFICNLFNPPAPIDAFDFSYEQPIKELLKAPKFLRVSLVIDGYIIKHHEVLVDNSVKENEVLIGNDLLSRINFVMKDKNTGFDFPNLSLYASGKYP